MPNVQTYGSADVTVSELCVKELQAGEQSRWNAFVEGNQSASFFHLAEWRQIIENHLGHPTHYLYCEKDGGIAGILPLAQVRSYLFGNALISLPFLSCCGPVSTDETITQLLLDRARELAEQLRVDYLELRNREPLDGMDRVTDLYVSFSKPLEPDPEKNLLAVPRKQRAMIRKGIKAGLVAETDDDASRLYRALLECKRNLGTPFFGNGYLQTIKETFGDRAEILTITKDQRLVCSVMSFRFRDEILPYYGGGGRIARGLFGNDFMYWAVMEKACREGVRVFDYGRSRVGSGAYRFKKHWGFEPRPLAYQYLPVKSQSLPNLNPSNPRYRLLINIWRRLPLPVAAVLGPPLARRLG